MDIKDAPKVMELAKVMADKSGLSAQEALMAVQITVLAKLTEVISRKEFICGQDF